MNYHITVINKNYFGSKVVIKMKCVRSVLRSLWGESSGEPGPVFNFNLKRFENLYLLNINTGIHGKLREENKYIHVKGIEP